MNIKKIALAATIGLASSSGVKAEENHKIDSVNHTNNLYNTTENIANQANNIVKTTNTGDLIFRDSMETILYIPNFNFTEGETVNIDFSSYAVLPDGETLLSYNLQSMGGGGIPAGLSFDSNTGILSGVASEVGSFDMEFAMETDVSTYSQNFNCNILQNQAPIADSFISVGDWGVGKTIDMKPRISDFEDPDNSLTIETVSQPTNGVVVVDGTNLDVQLNQGGESSNFTYLVRDTLGAVSSVETVSLEPVISTIPDLAYNSGENVSDNLSSYVVLPDGETLLSYDLHIVGGTGLPSGLSFDPNTGLLTGNSSQVGSFNLEFVVNSSNQVYTRTFSFTVESIPNTAPVARDNYDDYIFNWEPQATFDMGGDFEDAESPDSQLDIIVLTQPTGIEGVPKASLSFNGSLVTITMDPGKSGRTEFTYKIRDPQNAESQVRTIFVDKLGNFTKSMTESEIKEMIKQNEFSSKVIKKLRNLLK